jgi:predicted ATPase
MARSLRITGRGMMEPDESSEMILKEFSPMTARLKSIRIRNYRSLADVSLNLQPVNVLFGPNGAGKSTLLDTIWFIRDCAIRSVELASANRDHGIGLLFDGADDGSAIELELATERITYALSLGISAGRLEPFAGEKLYSLDRDAVLFERRPGTTKADFFHLRMGQSAPFDLREPEKLSFARYLDFEPNCDEAIELDRILHFVHLYHSRSLNLWGLKERGSNAGYETWLKGRGDNLWSVLRNLEGRRRLDERYDTIMRYMARSFPTFDSLVIEPTGPNALYAKFLEKWRREPILASGISDGHLQLLILLTALFSEGRDRYSMMLIDEPETSLHPWALAVLAEAIIEAADEWGKQVILATHSPVLISQFEPEQILAVEQEGGRTRITRLSEIEDIKDLLQEYAPGSLYMSEVVGAQSKPADHVAASGPS